MIYFIKVYLKSKKRQKKKIISFNKYKKIINKDQKQMIKIRYKRKKNKK